jgi:hypothetical protein
MLVGLIGLAACGDDGPDAEPAPVPRPTTTAASPSTTTTTVEPAAAPTTAPAGPIAVTSVDYGFEGVPAELPAGRHELNFTNAGTEVHELVIFRNPEALSLEELHALGPEGAAERVELAGLAFAEPGQPSPEPLVVELTPGEYEVVCFIPTPTDGQPHFAHGMHTTITVV